MRYIKGATLVEAILGFAGLGIILLMVYTLFMGGVKSWTTITPQIDARKVAREILDGKTGDPWGGFVGEMKRSQFIRVNSPGEIGVTTSPLQINFEGEYQDRGTTTPLRRRYFISYKWEGVNRGDPLANGSVTCVGTLTKTIWELIGDTHPTWQPPQGIKTYLAKNVRLNRYIYNNGAIYYSLFKYYTGLGVEIHPDRVGNAIAANEIRQIGISMVFDIDNDKDGSFGEDPIGDDDEDEDRKVDEDRPIDFRIKTKAACMIF